MGDNPRSPDAASSRSMACEANPRSSDAATERVETLAKAELEAHGITTLERGSIEAEKIDQHKLIDQHFYAIASKATILKPEQLNVPDVKLQGASQCKLAGCPGLGQGLHAMVAAGP